MTKETRPFTKVYDDILRTSTIKDLEGTERSFTLTNRMIYSRLLVRFYFFKEEGTDEVFITQQTLAGKYGVSIKTIQRALAKFITYGFIAEKNTRGRCNTYIMNDIDNVDFRSEYTNKNMKRETSFATGCQPDNTRWSKA